MGGLLSKRPSMRPTRRISGGGSGSSNGIGGGHQENGADGSRTSGDTNAGESGIQYTAELTSYEAACRLDPELRSFDAALQQRTSHAISTLALGVELRCLSFDTLREVTGCLLETNKQVVNAILECRKDVWKSPELLSLVDEYFECSIQTLDYCTELEKCLKKARDSHLIIQFAIQRFEEEDKEKNEVVTEQDGKMRYTVTLEKLRHFKAADFAIRDEEAVKFAIEEIKKNLEVFMKNIEDLGVEVDRCSRDTSKARMVVVRTIIKHPRE
ncbi:hypothetical protein BHM03_00063017 [Ensete ventricosum]|nr:hypothetical protein BHM03_00063017 [Ensete ventricosum]